jgi:heme exporter protein A
MARVSASPSSSWSAAPPCLAAVGLGCARAGRPLFSRLSLEVRPGQLLWLRGANGRGKTSLLRLAAGLASPDAGELRWDGQPLGTRRQPLYLAHANGLKDDLSVGEALQFLLRLHGRAADATRIQAALSRMGLHGWRDAPMRTLSQGQRRRVALARLAAEDEPALWLLDEPFDALDADGVQRVNGLLVEHLQRGGGVLLTSHVPVDIDEPRAVVVHLDAYA